MKGQQHAANLVNGTTVQVHSHPIQLSNSLSNTYILTHHQADTVGVNRTPEINSWDQPGVMPKLHTNPKQ